MRTLVVRCLLVVALVAQSGFATGAEPGPAQAAFERLKGLQGSWEGKFADGRWHTVDYRLSAGGTVLVETWQLAPGRESMTLYHLDGDRLLATHFCPQGNQPRLQLVPGPDDSVLAFEFVDGTGLNLPDRSHQHSFVTVMRADGNFSRSETYVENGAGPEALKAAEADAPIEYMRLLATPEPQAKPTK